MADAIPLGSEPQAPVVDAADAAPAPVKKAKAPAKAPAKVLADGFEIPEGAVQLDSHEAYRVDN